MDKLVAVVAYLILLAFLGILLWHVPRLDLTLVIGLTVVLAGWDLVRSLREGA
ncbi:MAG: hypothetical protein ACK4S2_12415 [Gemmobacter sp.]|uniref:hypothetical protein n=1 Tax=Gemmobacter sp. TaxID=1898957 RepID=UPI00391A9AF4